MLFRISKEKVAILKITAYFCLGKVGNKNMG